MGVLSDYKVLASPNYSRERDYYIKWPENISIKFQSAGGLN